MKKYTFRAGSVVDPVRAAVWLTLMALVAAAWIAVGAIVCRAVGQTPPPDAFMFVGQSNLIGPYLRVTPLPVDEGYLHLPEISVVDPVPQPDLTRGEWPPPTPATAALPRWEQVVDRSPIAPTTKPGMDVYAARQIAYARRRAGDYAPFVVAKHAVGASGLRRNWLAPPQGLALMAQWQLMTRRWERELARAPRWRALVWWQGETDTLTLADAYAYGSNLRFALRKMSAWMGGDVAVVIVRTRIATNSTAWRTRTDLVRRAQQRVCAELPRCRLINVDDLPMKDQMHLAAPAHATVGHRVYAALDALGAAGGRAPWASTK